MPNVEKVRPSWGTGYTAGWDPALSSPRAPELGTTVVLDFMRSSSKNCRCTRPGLCKRIWLASDPLGLRAALTERSGHRRSARQRSNHRELGVFSTRSIRSCLQPVYRSSRPRSETSRPAARHGPSPHQLVHLATHCPWISPGHSTPPQPRSPVCRLHQPGQITVSTEPGKLQGLNAYLECAA